MFTYLIAGRSFHAPLLGRILDHSQDYQAQTGTYHVILHLAIELLRDNNTNRCMLSKRTVLKQHQQLDLVIRNSPDTNHCMVSTRTVLKQHQELEAVKNQKTFTWPRKTSALSWVRHSGLFILGQRGGIRRSKDKKALKVLDRNNGGSSLE